MENDGRTRYRPEEMHRTAWREEGEAERVEGHRRAGETGERAKRRVRRAADERRPAIAGRMDRLGRRLRERGRSLEPHGGLQGTAGRAARRVGERIERGAEYIRTHDIGEMRSDLEVQVRDRPLTSVAIALGTGFLLGRIFR